MNKISIKSIEKAAERIAAKHFFSYVESQDDVDAVWSWCNDTNDAEQMRKSYDAHPKILVWEPFEEWAMIDVLGAMNNLRASVFSELSLELL